MIFNVNDVTTALIIGAGKGIGLAFVKELLDINNKTRVIATFRKFSNELESLSNQYSNLELIKFDPLQKDIEDNFKSFAEQLGKIEPEFDLIINNIGILHNDEELKPERRLQDIKIENLEHSFKVNAFITPLLAKHLKSFLSKEKSSCFTTLSAKVGSITDNRMGGWYAYRASKSALNMFIKNIAIELERERRKCLVLSLHPGTTKTSLSAPYTKNTNYQLHEPRETAKNLLSVINKMEVSKSGSFYSWDGEELPW